MAYRAVELFSLLGAEPETVAVVQSEPDWEPRLSWLMEQGPFKHVNVISGHKDLRAHYDVAFSVFYDRILPPWLIDRIGLPLNLHPAPLPRYRGVRPINWALKNGEREHGVTIHRMTYGVDDGPIYGRVTFPIWPEIDEVRDVYERMLVEARNLMKEVIPRLHEIEPYEQDHDEATINRSADNHLLGDRSDWTREVSVL